jgi:hypothetical protein
VLSAGAKLRGVLMYDQESIALINHLLAIRLRDKNAENSTLKASEFEEILEILLDHLPPPPKGATSRLKWSLIERKKLFDYLQHINCEVIEDRILPFG